jgi:competence ComEA-like helix-hairpin-helix protein
MRVAAIFLLVLIFVSCTMRTDYTRQAPAGSAADINAAAAADLERLPGIGAGTAAAIVSHREQYGAFRRREHLLLVPGVSETRYQKAFLPPAR